MPTELRSQGTALANVMSMVSQIASPYIVESVRIQGIAMVSSFFKSCYLAKLNVCELIS